MRLYALAAVAAEGEHLGAGLGTVLVALLASAPLLLMYLALLWVDARAERRCSEMVRAALEEPVPAAVDRRAM